MRTFLPSVTGFRKSVSRMQALSEKDVCDLQPHDVLEVCQQTIVFLNRSMPKFAKYTASEMEPETCSTHALKFHWLHPEGDSASIHALKCPSTSPVWILDLAPPHIDSETCKNSELSPYVNDLGLRKIPSSSLM